MSFIERFLGKKNPEDRPEQINQLKNAILTQAEQWRMEGTSWWWGLYHV